jgi:hypothetical protein
LIAGSDVVDIASGGRIATGVNVVLGALVRCSKPSSLSDFINGCSGCLAVVITTSETSALASDANPIFTATIAPRLIKQIRASQTVLIIKGPHGIGRLGRNIWCCEPTQNKKAIKGTKRLLRRGHKIAHRRRRVDECKVRLRFGQLKGVSRDIQAGGNQRVSTKIVRR